MESVGEDDELTVENGESSYEIAVKYSRGGRKHSLPQQLESAGARQVGGKAGLALSTSLCSVLRGLSGAPKARAVKPGHIGTSWGLKPGLDTKVGVLGHLWRTSLL